MKKNTKKNTAKVQGEKISLGQFLTLLCASQKITTPDNEKMHSGTINIFNKFKPEGKVVGLNKCKAQNRDIIFDSFPKICQYENIVMNLNRQTEAQGAIRRVIEFKTDI